ncbi:MAG TPA: hypothetical protein VHH88_00650 [Verrucomicrobiae bacterium]|nr:hypothetical protein [Verrucomicrobiae bacterium]
MSATEIIAEIEKLSGAELEAIRQYLLKGLEAAEPSPGAAGCAGTAEFETSSAKIFREHADLFRRLAQ